jgi:hypothetical protein
MTPNPNKHSDDEIKVRSLLMRMYHSRQIGEAFYHANLVNGEAPKLEADGWIEQHGEGWRLTDMGLRRWAEMNQNSFHSKYHYAGPFYKAMRDQLVEGEDEVNICKKEGCDKPRMISKSGVVQTYCDVHQREKWAADKREEYQKVNATTAKPKPSKRDTTPKSAGNWVDGEPDTIKHEVVDVNPAFNPWEQAAMQEQIAKYVQHAEEAINGRAPDPCDQCEAKAVIEALRAKSPKLAKLIDAMQAEVDAARELGI